MEFRIADTFTDSLARLTGDEQKAAKTTAFDLQLNPANPGLSFHKLDRAQDRNFWSVRVSRDIRLIVHKTANSLLLCYVDHHDRAYGWAERRKLEAHPKTGAAQLVEIRQTVREIVVPTMVPNAPVAKPTLFAAVSDDALLSCGVPPEWLGDVRQADEDALLTLVEHLPAEAAEALLELATGGVPRSSAAVAAEGIVASVDLATPPAARIAGPDPFDHPDAQRRFRVIADVAELEQALAFPWDKWTIFLHPEQRQLVEREYTGPARVSGSAGTGKTIVALHRAVFLARRHPDARILMTTFSDVLASALRTRLRRLVGSEPSLAERIDVAAIDAVGARLHKALVGAVTIASETDLRELLAASSATVSHKFNLDFLRSEWTHVVDAWRLDSWEAYRDVARLGRKTRLPEAQRATLWRIFEPIRAGLTERGLVTRASLFGRLADAVKASRTPPYDFAVVDEAQDFTIAHLRFFAALGGGRPNALFFAGDLGQRIFQLPFSWKAVGVDVRGRARTLRVNYRTSHQIRRQADRLLEPEIADADGNVEGRSDTISVFNGTPPDIRVLDDAAAEAEVVGAWLAAHRAEGIEPHELGVFVRSDEQLARAQRAVAAAGLSAKILDATVETPHGVVAVGTMHLAKGLEFRAVAVMACDDEVVPLQSRVEAVGDDSDLQEVYDTERHLLYVACTRARDHLLVTGVKPASEFLDDLGP